MYTNEIKTAGKINSHILTSSVILAAVIADKHRQKKKKKKIAEEWFAFQAPEKCMVYIAQGKNEVSKWTHLPEKQSKILMTKCVLLTGVIVNIKDYIRNASGEKSSSVSHVPYFSEYWSGFSA